MNLTDLRDELDQRTQDLSADIPSLTAGIAGKVRATKRRRAGGAAGGVVAALLVVGMAVANQPGRPVVPAPAATTPSTSVGADGMPSRVLPDRPGDVVKDGLRLRATVAEDTLAVGVIGDPGERVVRATWTPRTQRVAYVVECWLPPGQDPATAKETWVRASISGQEGYFGGTCRADLPTAGDLSASITPGEPGEGNPQIRLGTDTTLRVELVDRDGRPLTNPGVRLAAGIYELGPQLPIEDDRGQVVGALPEVVEHQGYRYLLGPVVYRSLASGALPRVEAPATGPYLVRFGTVGTGRPGADPGFFQLGGLGEATSLVQEGGLTTAPQPAGAGQALSLQLAEGTLPKDGYGVIAIYVPAH
ncbi:hypothetical protein [Intrasporangium calvum]|uniref:hypothetical protein n=1 Tax=Intrasporangium calvum TaxID=53358 RepID=UPI000DF5F680|nr:hypothetical protein [Intrasporangium calvum]AXG14911.1 hypothetical protein DN585_17205 [Intrasporangium calvum]